MRSDPYANAFEQIGIDHNNYLDELLPFVDTFESLAEFDSLLKVRVGSIVEVHEMSSYDSVLIYGKNDTTALEYVSANKSTVYYNYFKYLIDTIKYLPETYSAVDNFVSSEVYTLNNSSFSSQESEELLSFLALLKHSAEYWMPSNVGGEANYNKIKEENFPSTWTWSEPDVAGIEWWRVWLSDAAGAVTFGTIGAVTTAGVGGPPGAIGGLVSMSVGSIISQIGDPCDRPCTDP